MDKEISKRDWETISAYLDGQLSAKELARFESRLSQESMLRTALNELYEARLVLRNTPRLHPPRNFLLTYEMVGKPRGLPRLAPAFGWASAVTSFLFVFILIGSLIRSQSAIPVAEGDMPQSVILSQEIVEPGVSPMSANPMIPDEGSTEKYSESAELEGENIMGVAAIPEMETVPDKPAIDMVPTAALTEEPLAESGVAVAEAPMEEVTADAVMITDTTRSGGQTEEFLAVSEPLSPTLTETSMVQEGGHHIEKTATEEAVAAGPEIVVTQVPPTAQLATEDVPLAKQVASSTPEAETEDEDLIDSAVTTSETDWNAALPEEQIQHQVSEGKTSDMLLGLEVFLMLSALGTGIAWIYLRRRGG